MKMKRETLFFCCFLACAMIFISCKEKKEPVRSEAVSYVIADSLQTWCKHRLPETRVSYEGSTMKLLFFEEELNLLWKPGYNEDAVKEMAANNFQWEELPVHEGNRRWQLSLLLQPEDSTYVTPNNLLLYLFR
jgi:hypothetical protein